MGKKFKSTTTIRYNVCIACRCSTLQGIMSIGHGREPMATHLLGGEESLNGSLIVATSIAAIKFKELDLGSSYTTIHRVGYNDMNYAYRYHAMRQGVCQKLKRFRATKPTQTFAERQPTTRARVIGKGECIGTPKFDSGSNRWTLASDGQDCCQSQPTKELSSWSLVRDIFTEYKQITFQLGNTFPKYILTTVEGPYWYANIVISYAQIQQYFLSHCVASFKVRLELSH